MNLEAMPPERGICFLESTTGILNVLMGSLFGTQELSAMSGGIRPPAPKNYSLPTQFPSFAKVKRLCFDVEGKDPSLAAGLGPGWRRNAFISGFSIAFGDAKGNAEFSEYYPLRHKGCPNLDVERTQDWLREELSFFQGELVGANLLYDGDAAQYQNILAPLAQWRDVQWAESLIDENAYNYQLERLGQKYCGHGKAKDELKALYGSAVKERMDEVHPGHMRVYGIGDVVLPLQILHEQYKELRRQHLEEVFDLESRLTPMLLYMRRKGQPVDLVVAEQLRDKFTERRVECLREATRLVGKRGFELNVENFGKPEVMVAALDALGIPYPRTAKGHPSIKDKWLEALDHPFGKALAAANKYDKALETFVTGYISDYQINGRVHCEFHPLRRVDDEGRNNGTVTGRFSGVHPNLQNIPVRDEEIGPLCRSMFIAEQGHDFFSGDFSQIEFRLLVHAAVVRANLSYDTKRPWGDEIFDKLKTAFVAQERYKKDPSTDFHNMVVDLTGLARKFSKGINFGIAFTMGVDKLALQLGLVDGDGNPTPKAISILAQYHEKVPFVKAVGHAMSREAQVDGYVTSLLGRRSHFDLWEPKYQEKGSGRPKALPLAEAKAAYGDKLKRAQTHTALNRFTQGGGADLIKISMVRAWESGILDNDDLIVSLTVHDELDGSVSPAPAGKEKLRELQHIMETAFPLEVPVLTEFRTGNTWAETH